MLRERCPNRRSLFLGSLVALAIGLVGASPASASSCNLVAVDPGGTVTGPSSLTFATRAPAVIKFNCSGTTQPPALQATGTGNLSFSIGPAVRPGSLWEFTLTRQNGLAESGQLLFKDEDLTGSPTQLINVTVLASGEGPGAGTPPTCEERSLAEGGVLGSLEAREPGATAFAAVPENVLCTFLTLRDAVSGAPAPDGSGRVGAYINVEAAPQVGGGEWTWPYPEGTVFRIAGRVPNFTPVHGAGSLKNPRLQIEGDRFVVEGQAITRKVFDASLGESGCADADTQTILSGVVFGDWIGSQYQGTIVGANGYTASQPKIDSSGSIEYFVAGCGDGNPTTLEGFYDAQFGKAFLDSGGVTQAVLAASDDPAVQALFNVTNNGQASGATFAKAAGQDGQIVVLMNYRTSFSAHTISVRANKKATAFARKCTKAKGSKLRTRKQTIRVKKKRVKATFLTCTPKKGKSSKLKVG